MTLNSSNAQRGHNRGQGLRRKCVESSTLVTLTCAGVVGTLCFDNSAKALALPARGGVCTPWTHTSKIFLLTASKPLIDSTRVVSQPGGVHEQVVDVGGVSAVGADGCDGSEVILEPVLEWGGNHEPFNLDDGTDERSAASGSVEVV